MKKLLLASAIAAACGPGFVSADIRINGFANLTAGFTTSENVDGAGNTTDLFGYDDNVDFSNGSLFAIQISGDVNEKVTATAQLLARGENDYEADFEWAYLTYSVNDNFSVNAGRLRLPLFRYSASSDVGYSFHWAQTPFSVYDVPFTNLDGLRLDYTNNIGDWDYTLQLGSGTYTSEIGGGVADGEDVLLITAEATYESFKARLVYGQSNTTFTEPTTDAAFAQLAQISPVLADKIALRDDSGTFTGLGLEYDNFTWFVSGEITKVTGGESFSADDNAYFVTMGTRIGKFTPSITYEARDGVEDLKFLEDIAALPAQFQPAATQIVVGFQNFFYEDYALTTVGLRYDLDSQVALKFDVSSYENKIQDALDATLVRIAVNYVF
ncbi:topoisomerase IV [Glaciecola sp. KUL10]|jgi:hypothetical protein|uniref:topoisomerase IV n=1 Tax=Glaciecola sp. (strain KUL10) TaxID=2161813 RepID=UPI000D81C4B5|nr:topoisomerase IV [Glaciecola sp. KUL10]GBL03229.1 hypothetical protein KUL10_05110 [Glaciecola sp. KUL10]